MMFVIGGAGGINEYALLAPFDLSTASFANAAFPASSLDSPQGMAFSNDGTTMFVVDSSKGEINEYTLPAPFGISTAEFTNVTFSVSSQETSPTGMAFSNDGARMFVTGGAGGINEYALLAPFDISTADFVDAFSVSSQETSPTGMAFSNDGARMFVTGDAGGIHEYALISVYPMTVVLEVDGSPASRASVTSTIPDGAYGPGTVIDVQISFDEPVSLRTFPITDSRPRVEGLSNAQEVLFMQADGRHYAVVADQGNEAVRIVDVSDPDRPDPVFTAENGTSFALDGPVAVDMVTIGERKYVLVGTSGLTSIGLQLIDVTNPQNPLPGGAVARSAG